MMQRWRLDNDGDRLGHGYHAIVVPVRRGATKPALKLAWPAGSTVTEARALAAWRGCGAVRLYEADTRLGALLLQRLDADQTLSSLPLGDAAARAARILRLLCVSAPAGFPGLRHIAGMIATTLAPRQASLGDPIPASWFGTVQQLANRCARHAGESLLIHADLHYDNILADESGAWVAIDPKPVAGEPEYAVPELLWTRLDELDDEYGIRQLLDVLVSSAGLDADRTRAWALVRSADYWLWGLEHGLTHDPASCRRILAALL